MHTRSSFSLRRAVATASLLACSAMTAFAADSAGSVDFGAIPGPDGRGEQVEVDLPRNIIAIASRILAKQEPEIAKLLDSVHAVRVRVVSLDEGNRAAVQKRMDEIRAELTRGGWHKVVTARDSGEDVAVFMRTTEDDAIEGVAVTVMDGDNEAVFVNVIGAIRPEQIAEIAEALNVPHLAAVTAGLHD